MRSTFIGLPTSDVARATAFYAAIGFARDERASGERTAAFVINESTSVLLQAADWFSEFTGAPVADPATCEVSVGVTVGREEVDELTDRALAAGATHGATQDLGYLYMRAFRDPDGHRWSFLSFAQG